MATPLDVVLGKLDGVVRRNGHFMARCPAHADRNPSLSVKQGEGGRVLLTCYAGCDYRDILTAIDLEPGDLFPEPPASPPPKRIVQTTRYPIRDRLGNLVATHTRVDYDDGSKDVTWPVGTRPKELPLYGIHELDDHHYRVVIVEGEKARDALQVILPPNVLALGTVCGASSTPAVEQLRQIGNRIVTLWPDNDDPGRRHMERIAERIERDVEWIDWPAAPPKGDAADWIANGGTDPFDPESGLFFLSSGTLTSTGNTEERNLNTIETPPVVIRPVAELWAETDRAVEWLAEPWVRCGGMTMIAGKPKTAGKTTLVFHLIKAVLTDGRFLGMPVKPGPVVLVSEQGGASLHEALDAVGVATHPDLHVSTYRDVAMAPWPATVAWVFAYAARVGAVLVVVDTLTACASVVNENDAGEAREAMKPIAIGSDTTGIGSIVTFHDRKGEADVGESQRGSSAYAGAVDIVLRLMRPGGNFEPNVRRIEALSRFTATPEELFIQLVGETYQSLGSENEVIGATLRQALASILPANAAEAMPVVDRKLNNIVTEPGILPALAAAGIRIGRERLDQTLFLGYRAGAFGRSGEARKNSPHRFWLADPASNFLSSGFAETPRDAEERNEMLSSDATSPSEESISPEESIWTAARAETFWNRGLP